MPTSLEPRVAGPPPARPLTGSPLRVSRSMLTTEALLIDCPGSGSVHHPGNESQPLGYLYQDWDPGITDQTEIDAGYYDEDTQTWVDNEGIITGGIPTRTRMSTVIDWGKWKWDYPADDACF